MLRARREEQGLTLDEIAQGTRIHVKHLQAIESGDLLALPGVVYARAFVRHYARWVNLDPDETVQQFDALTRTLPTTTTSRTSVGRSRRQRSQRRRGKRRVAWQWVGVALFLALLGYIVTSVMDTSPFSRSVDVRDSTLPTGIVPELSGIVTGDEPDAFNEQDASVIDLPEQVSDLDVAAGTVGLDRVEDVADGEAPLPITDEAVAAVSEPPSVLSSAQDRVEDQVQDHRVEEDAVVSPTAAETVAAVDAVEIPPPLVAASAVVLQVEVTRDCWFEVVADGERLFVGVLEAGREATWSAERTLSVRYGRPEGVHVTLNGEYLGVPGTGVITRVYTPDGVQEEA